MITQVEIESLGFELIQDNGILMEYVFYKNELTSYVLTYGSLHKGKNTYNSMFRIKEVNKSFINDIYTGPIKNKKELKFLIELN